MKFFRQLILTLTVMLIFSGVSLAQNEVTVFIDDEPLDFPDQQPFIDEANRTQVPVRFVSSALDADLEWISDEERIEITRGDDFLELYVGEEEYTLNGETKDMDTAAVITDEGRTVVPLRFITEGLGADVDWDGDNRRAFIYSPVDEEEEEDDKLELSGDLSDFEVLGEDHLLKDRDSYDYDNLVTLDRVRDRVITFSTEARQAQLGLDMMALGVEMAKDERSNLEELEGEIENLENELEETRRERDRVEDEYYEAVAELKEMADYLDESPDIPHTEDGSPIGEMNNTDTPDVTMSSVSQAENDTDNDNNEEPNGNGNDENGEEEPRYTEEDYNEQQERVNYLWGELQELEAEIATMEMMLETAEDVEDIDEMMDELDQEIEEMEQELEIAYREWSESGQEQLKHGVESLYVGLLLTDYQVTAAEASKAVTDRQVEQEELRAEVGMSTETDVDALKLEQHELENSLISAENNREDLRRELMTMIGRPVDHRVHPEPIGFDLEQFQEDFDLDDALDYALDEGVAVDIAEEKVEYAEDNKEWAEDHHGSNSDEYDMYRAELDQAELEKEEVEEDLEKSIIASYDKFNEAMNDVEMAKRARDLAEDGVEAGKITYDVGMSTELDYLDNLTGLLEADNFVEMAELQAYLAKKELQLLTDGVLVESSQAAMDAGDEGMDQMGGRVEDGMDDGNDMNGMDDMNGSPGGGF